MNVINKKYQSLDNFADIFRNAKPFPHLELDDFLDADFFAEIKLDFPNKWFKYAKLVNVQVNYGPNGIVGKAKKHK